MEISTAISGFSIVFAFSIFGLAFAVCSIAMAIISHTTFLKEREKEAPKDDKKR